MMHNAAGSERHRALATQSRSVARFLPDRGSTMGAAPTPYPHLAAPILHAATLLMAWLRRRSGGTRCGAGVRVRISLPEPANDNLPLPRGRSAPSPIAAAIARHYATQQDRSRDVTHLRHRALALPDTTR